MLICDVYIPGVDGVEFLAELSKSGYQGAVMLVSGGDDNIMSIAPQLAEAGGLKVVGAHTKPVPLLVLKEAFNRI